MKKIQFTDEVDQHARLLVRLRYDGIKQSDFFRSIVSLYIEKDIDMIKGNITKIGKRKIKSSTREIQKGEELMKDLGLSNKERSEIFDLIEGDFDSE